MVTEYLITIMDKYLNLENLLNICHPRAYNFDFSSYVSYITPIRLPYLMCYNFDYITLDYVHKIVLFKRMVMEIIKILDK